MKSLRTPHTPPRPNKTDAGNGSYGICRVIDASRSPSPDPGRSAIKMDPTIAIYRRRTDLVALATGRTTMGVRIETGPGVILPMNLPADQIGLAIIGLFDGCGATVEHSKTFGGPETPLFRLTKVSSWAEFARRGRPDYLTVTLIGAMVEVERWWREGRGYTYASPRQVVAFHRDVAPQMLGDVLIAGSIEPDAEPVAAGQPATRSESE